MSEILPPEAIEAAWRNAELAAPHASDELIEDLRLIIWGTPAPAPRVDRAAA